MSRAEGHTNGRPDSKPGASRLRMGPTSLRPHARLAWMVEACVITGIFVVIEPTIAALGALPRGSYDSSVLFPHALRFQGGLLLCAIAALALLRWRHCGWTSFDGPRHLKWLLAAAAWTLAWAFSTYEYNFYLDQTHHLDRLLLVVFAAGVPVHPAFLPLALCQAYLLTGQFSTPLFYSWTDKIPLYQALGIASTAIALKLVIRRVTGVGILWSILAMFAAFYAVSGWAKVRLSWFGTNHIEHLVSSAHFQNGWLSWLGPDAFETLTQTASAIDPAIKVFTLVVEIGVLFWVFHRRLAVSILSGCVLLHAGIFSASGIFFWKWMILDLGLIALILTMEPPLKARLFGVGPGLGVAALSIAFALLSARPVQLGWYDGPWTYRFRFDAVAESGNRYSITAADLAPFDLPFAQGRLLSLGERPHVLNTFGTVHDLQLYSAILRAGDASDLERIRLRHGENRYRIEPQAFDQLIQRYVRWRRRERDRRGLRWSTLGAPQHIWTAWHTEPALPRYRGQEDIAEVQVRLTETYDDGSRAFPVFDDTVRRVTISPGQTGEPVPLRRE